MSADWGGRFRLPGHVDVYYGLLSKTGKESHMRVRAAFIAIALITGSLTGCATTESGTTTFPLGSIIGLFGMAVDGDDKDDYEHWFDSDDDCESSSPLTIEVSRSE